MYKWADLHREGYERRLSDLIAAVLGAPWWHKHRDLCRQGKACEDCRYVGGPDEPTLL